MKRTLIAAAGLALVAASGVAGAASWSVVVEPGVYGRVAIGGYAEPPQVYSEQPVVAVDDGYGGVVEEYVEPDVSAQAPVYLWVPEYQRTHWAQYCRSYGAYGVPVFFVDDGWYRQNVMGRRWSEEQRSWNRAQWIEQDRLARERWQHQRWDQQRWNPQPAWHQQHQADDQRGQQARWEQAHRDQDTWHRDQDAWHRDHDRRDDGRDYRHDDRRDDRHDDRHDNHGHDAQAAPAWLPSPGPQPQPQPVRTSPQPGHGWQQPAPTWQQPAPTWQPPRNGGQPVDAGHPVSGGQPHPAPENGEARDRHHMNDVTPVADRSQDGRRWR